MQREGWGRHRGKGTKREGARDGERDAVAREQHHRGPQKTGQGDSPSFLLNLLLRSDAGNQRNSSRNKRDADGKHS